MMKKRSLEEELKYILGVNDIKDFMDKNAKTLRYRLTPMIVGLFLDDETDVTKTVNTWLYRMGEEQINIRGIESTFAFVYERYKSAAKELKLEKWQALYKRFFEKANDTLVEKSFEPIDTFGDLCKSLETDSDMESTSSAKTYNTRNDTTNLISPEFNKLVHSEYSDEDAFEKYLDFLYENQAGYQRKGTYFLRRLLYQIITRGLRLLYDRDEFAYTKEENGTVRKATLSIADGEAFNRFIDCNSLCLSDIKWVKKASTDSLKSFLGYDKECDMLSTSYDECKKWLSNKEIKYGALVSDFYELFGSYNEKPLEYRIIEEHLQEDKSISNKDIESFLKPVYKKIFRLNKSINTLIFFSTDENKKTQKEKKKEYRIKKLISDVLVGPDKKKNFAWNTGQKNDIKETENEILKITEYLDKEISSDITSVISAKKADEIEKKLDRLLILFNRREFILTKTLGDIKYDAYEILYHTFSDGKNMYKLKDAHTFKADSPEGISTTEFLIKTYAYFEEKDNRHQYTTLVRNMVSGTINVSRRMLALFAMFAGCSEYEINEILEKSGFLPLEEHSTFDKAMTILLETNFKLNREKMYNTKDYLAKTNYDSPRENKKEEIAAEKEKYEKKLYEQILLLEFEQISLIKYSPHIPSVADIFMNDRLKNIMEREVLELEKLKKDDKLKKLIMKM